MLPRTKHSLGCWLKIRLLRQENVGNKFLRISIDHRKPGALNLDHNSMALLKGVIVRRESDLVVINSVCGKRFRLLKAHSVATSKDVARDHQLVPAHALICFKLFRINVYELNDPVTIRTRR